MIKPNYYFKDNMDVIEFARLMLGDDAAKSFCRINVLKYITRYDKKNGVEDLEKAITYIKRLIVLEGNRIKKPVRNYIIPVEGVRTHRNGMKEYKCAYRCKCGNEGIRYIHIDADRTACHKCKSELKVYPSTENEAHDEEFNYFIAHSEDDARNEG